MIKNGGNIIKTDLDLDSKQIIFSDNEHYYYSFYNLQKDEKLIINFLKEYTVFVKTSTNDAKLNILFEDDESINLNKLDSVDIIGLNTTLTNRNEVNIHILIAGIRDIEVDKSTYHIIRAGDIKKVFKPWGHELWINKYNESYSLKEVFLKEGRRTSLQYHNFKQETNVLFNGTARMWYKKDDSISNDLVENKDIDYKEINATSSVDVTPKVLHRVQSITDVLLYEASTPHLDDVIRVHDDNKREDGTIKSEHQLQVCILAAGIGSRMGGLTDTINKSLLPIKDKAVISGIIEKFPKTSKFIVAIGYKGQQVKDYILCAYPEYEFHFVNISNYNNKGSGPGHSLLKCRPFLDEQPFYFTVSDAIYNFDIPFDLHENWIGVTKVNYATSHDYCNFSIEENKITSMQNKETYTNEHSKSFVGLSYIFTVDNFWKGIEDNYLSSGEHQMTNGLLTLIEKENIKPIDVNWIDMGSFEKYSELVNGENGFNFSKLDEYIYFVNNKVIKFFKDSVISNNRVKKAKMNSNVFPKIEYSGEQFYSYELLEGDILYKKVNNNNFKDFLSWMKNNLWHIKIDDISKECKAFYKDKTMQRVSLMLDKYNDISLTDKLTINGKKCNSMKVILDDIDWNLLINENAPSLMHGDLQFDNILITQDSFKLIDWRQDFAGLVNSGDIYYDIAKLYGGLIINYDLVKENYFTFHEDGQNKSFEFFTRNSMQELIEILEKFILEEGYNIIKVKQLVGIIFLNMSPLHHYPFDKLLYSLSNYMLDKELYENK